MGAHVFEKMTTISTVDRAKLICAELAKSSLNSSPKKQQQSKFFTVRLGHRKWTISNFSELPFCVRALLTRGQREQIFDHELQRGSPLPRVEVILVLFTFYT